MGGYLDSDAAFYAAVGAFTIAVFVLSLSAVAVFDPGGVAGPEALGLVVGFAIFMLVFFASIAVTRLADDEEI